MLTIIRNTVSKSRGLLVGWGIGLAALSVMIGSMFDMIADTNAMYDMVDTYVEAMPEMAAMFNMDQMGTPIGWLDVQYFSILPLMLCLLVNGIGANMLARDEEDGTLDLILAHPISRTSLFWGRFFASTMVIVFLILISWGSLLLTMTWSNYFSIPAFDLLMPFVSLFCIIMFFMNISLLFAMIMPARSMASMLCGMFVGASFFITLLSEVIEELQRVSDFSPLAYLETTSAVSDGLSLNYFIMFVAINLILAIVSWRLFQSRDIRVGGEGSWRLQNLKYIFNKN